eukprot:5247121-Prymnesium_polylepis.1
MTWTAKRDAKLRNRLAGRVKIACCLGRNGAVELGAFGVWPSEDHEAPGKAQSNARRCLCPCGQRRLSATSRTTCTCTCT